MASEEKITAGKSETITRRRFVAVSAAGGIAAGFLVGWLIKPGGVEAGGTVTKTVTSGGAAVVNPPQAIAIEPILPMRRVAKAYQGYHKVIDYGRCTGCRLCEFECAMRYQPDGFPGVNLEYSRIRLNRVLFVDMPIYCTYCHLETWVEGTALAACQVACPYGAIKDVAEVVDPGKIGNGYRWVDPTLCVGMELCGRCLEICEEQFGSGIVFLPPDENGVMKAAICTQCAGEPACVNACPEQAIRFETPRMDGRYYAHPPKELAEMLYLKLYRLKVAYDPSVRGFEIKKKE